MSIRKAFDEIKEGDDLGVSLGGAYYFLPVTRVIKTQVEVVLEGNRHKFSKYTGRTLMIIGQRYLSGCILYNGENRRLYTHDEMSSFIERQERYDEVRRLAGLLHGNVPWDKFSEDELREICRGCFDNASRLIWYQVDLDVLRMMNAKIEELVNG